jgi:hypothetical protein
MTESWVRRFLANDKRVFVLLALLLFFPLFFHGWRFGIPYIKGGDEPHYLVILNTLLNDGDFDVRNNYQAARSGSFDAGRKYAGKLIDPHIAFFLNDRFYFWWDIYEDPSTWVRDKDGILNPTVKPGVDPKVLEARRFPGHPVGIALILAPFLWPFRGTNYIEPAALVMSWLAVVFGAYFFRRILGRFIQDIFTVNLTTLLVFLGSPIWPYARMFFNESFLLFFVLGAYFFALQKNSGLLAGIMIGFGILMKPVIVVVALPFFWFWLARRDKINALLLALGCLLFTSVYLGLNLDMFGTIASPSPFKFGNPLLGAYGLLFYWKHGLLVFSPIALYVIFYWKRFLKEGKAEAVVLLGGFALYFLVMSCWWCWWGGWCFGPRHIVPVIPLLMIALAPALRDYPHWNTGKKRLFWTLCVLSLVFNAMGALDGYWDSHPLTLLMGNVS